MVDATIRGAGPRAAERDGLIALSSPIGYGIGEWSRMLLASTVGHRTVVPGPTGRRVVDFGSDVIYSPRHAGPVSKQISLGDRRRGASEYIDNRIDDRPALFEFAPDVGVYARKIADFSRELASSDQQAFQDLRGAFETTLSSTADGAEANDDLVRLLYCWSLLIDLYSAGSRVWVRDSRIFVSWPEWEGGGGRERAFAALRAASDLRPLRSDELERVKPLFVSDTDGKTMARVLSRSSQ